jgi:Putative papain-like cysteine peptidase (DUF1796)
VASTALDLAISLGPACQTAFNLRRFTGISRAFPFDWWVTPLHAVVAVIESRFELAIEPGNLEITPDRHSVLNKAFELLHHHDFRRVCGSVAPLDPSEVAGLRAKIAHLGGRFMSEVAAAREVGLFLSEVMSVNRYTRRPHDPRESCSRLFHVLGRAFPRTRFRLFVADPGPLRDFDERIVPLEYP